MSTDTRKDVTGEIAFLAREPKTPVIAETFAALGDQARTDGWSHEEYLAAVQRGQDSPGVDTSKPLRLSSGALVGGEPTRSPSSTPRQ
jgi:hypothetical protein